MNAPVLWIFIPGLVGIVLILFRGREKQASLTGALFAALLALLAWQAPIGESLRIGPLVVEISESITLLGRRFVLNDSDRPVLMLIYLGLAFWLAGSWIARPGPLFVPLSLAINSILTAALAVEPFLYGGLLLLMAVLVSIPMLVPPGKTAGRGVLRYLTFQTLGMPFLLFTGWLLEGVEAGSTTSELAASVGVLMGLGFAFVLGVFPFHTWIPMLAEEAHPYVAGFIFYVLPLSVSLFMLGFLEQFDWLRTTEPTFAYLRLAGMLMVLTSGIWAAVQGHLGRMMGYVVASEIGLSLLAISVSLDPGEASLLGIFFALLLPRGIGLGVWALALVKLSEAYPDLTFATVQGAALRHPVASATLVIAQLTLSGFPLLAGFPVHVSLFQALYIQFPLALIAALVGAAGLLLGGLRVLALLLISPGEGRWQVSESRAEILILCAGAAILIFAGLFPQLFFPAFTVLASAFAF